MDIEWPVSSRSMEEKPRLGCTLNKGNSLIGSSSARGIDAQPRRTDPLATAGHRLDEKALLRRRHGKYPGQ